MQETVGHDVRVAKGQLPVNRDVLSYAAEETTHPKLGREVHAVVVEKVTDE